MSKVQTQASVNHDDQWVSVKVIAENHVHKGVPVEPGNTIEVEESLIPWLIDNKIIEG